MYATFIRAEQVLATRFIQGDTCHIRMIQRRNMRKNGEGTCNRIDENTWVCDIFGNLVVEYMNTVYKGTVLDSTYHSYYKSVMNYLYNHKIFRSVDFSRLLTTSIDTLPQIIPHNSD